MSVIGYQGCSDIECSLTRCRLRRLEAENALLKRKLEIALRFIKEMQLNSFHVQADKVMTEIEEVK